MDSTIKTSKELVFFSTTYGNYHTLKNLSLFDPFILRFIYTKLVPINDLIYQSASINFSSLKLVFGL